MTLSTGRTSRLVVALLGALLLVTSLAPTVAGAGFVRGSTSDDLVSSRPGDSSVVLIGFENRECVEKDANTGDHHDEDTAETAKKWEREAEKAVDKKKPSADDHNTAAGRYAYAACLWDMISEFDKAEAAYKKAAEHYEQAAEKYEAAGEKEKAAEARKKAKEMRDKLD